MSTRCQVHVTGGENAPHDSVTLYHHCDGYPSNMLPLIAAGFVLGKGLILKQNERISEAKSVDPATATRPYGAWPLGRAGHAAALIIASDPLQFEPESSHDLHGDLLWLYIVRVSDDRQPGAAVAWPVWTVDVHRYADVRAFISVLQVIAAKLTPAFSGPVELAAVSDFATRNSI